MAHGGSRGALLLTRQALRRAATATTVLLGVVVLAVLVGISPLILTWFDRDEEWDRLSLIGQTYGAASALLAGLALVGIVVSLVLQVREYRASREQAQRMVHTDLIKMAMEDPLYRKAWGPFFASQDPDRQREHMFVNLVVSNLQMRWETRGISEHHLRASVGVLMAGEAGQRFWSAGRELRARAVTGRRQRRFHEIMDEEYHRAAPADGLSTGDTGGAPAEEPTAEPVPASPGTIRRSRRWWLLLGGGAAAAAAGAWLRRARREK